MNANEIADELNNITYSILEPHATYIHGTDDNHIRYFIPAEVLLALAWLVTNVITPILTGTAQSAISDKLKKRESNHEVIALALQKKLDEVEKLKRQVEIALEELRAARPPVEQDLLVARASLSEVLEINGWPSAIAKQDADQIVLSLRNRLWPPAA